jgi:hypothetical protein
MSAPVEALELGDWRGASVMLHDPNGVIDGLGPRLGVALRVIARSMAWRAAGSPGRASALLSDAALSLRVRLPVQPGPDGLIALPSAPKPDGPAYQAWRVVRLVWREQRELAWLRTRTTQHPPDLTPDQHILVLAVVEYLCWVQFDRGTWLVESSDTATRDREIADVESRIEELLTRPRDALLRCATELRRLNGQKSGDMTRAVWDRGHSYRGLRNLAIQELADRPPPPWTQPAPPDDVPARAGACTAWQSARPHR